MPSRWIAYRKNVNLGEHDPAEVVGHVFFQVWRRRQLGWALEPNDTLYWWDRGSGRLTWEWRAAAVLKREYDDWSDVHRYLAGVFGLLPEDTNLDTYGADAAMSGYLLAWSPVIVRPIDIQLPGSFKPGNLGARAGYVPWEKVPQLVRRRIEGLAPASTPLAEPPASYDPALVGGSRLRPVTTRYIPRDVVRAVYARDGSRCQHHGCGATKDLHLDHRWPYSRGGGSEAENLQLLCGAHNLSKGARIDPGVVPPETLGPRSRLAAAAQLLQTAPVATLAARAIENGFAGIAHEAVRELMVEDPDPGELPQLLRVLPDASWLAGLVATLLVERGDPRGTGLAHELLQDDPDNPEASLAQAIALEGVGEVNVDRLLNRAMTSMDPYVANQARVRLASALRDEARLQGQEVPQEAMHLWALAAEATDPRSRAQAAIELGIVAFELEDWDEAEDWFRHALIAPDPETFATAAVLLAYATVDLDPEGATAARQAYGENVAPSHAQFVERLERCWADMFQA
jgi:5-methylcytosine-specific restriction endonuclease McrA